MSRGEQAAAAGDWSTALTEYRSAFATKPTDDAAARAREAQANALEQSYANAQQALLIREYSKAGDELATIRAVAERDEPLIPALTKEIKAAIREDLRLRFEQGKTESGYELAVLGSKMQLDDPVFSAEVLETAREHVLAKAASQSKDHNYEAAIATLAVVTQFEPDREDLIALPTHEARVAWADELVDSAKKHWRAGRRGASAVVFARAYELGGRTEDLQSARTTAAGIESKTQLPYYLKVEGESWTRQKSLRDAIRAKLDGMSGVGRGGQTTSTLLITLDVPKAECGEGKATADKSVDYVSHQIDVPTPEYVALEERMALAKGEYDRAMKDGEALSPDVTKATRALAELDRDLDEVKAVLGPAERKLERAQTQVANQEELLAKLEKDLASAAPEDQSALQTKVSVIANNVVDWKNTLDTARTSHAEAAAKVEKLQTNRAPAAEAAERLVAAMKAVEEEQKRARKRMTDVQGEMTQTPPTMKQDVIANFAYKEYTWTRGCTAPVRAYVWTKWPSKLDKKLRLDPQLAAVDVAHVGHGKAQIREDLKDYGHTWQEQIAKGDLENAEKLATWAGAIAGEYFAVESAQTLKRLESSPMDATDELVSLYLGASAYLDEATIKAFQAHVLKNFGLTKLDFIRSEPTEP